MTDNNNSSMTDNQPPSNDNHESTTQEEEGASLGGTADTTAATATAVGMDQKIEAGKKGKMDQQLGHCLVSMQDMEDSILLNHQHHKCTTTKMAKDGPSPDPASSQVANNMKAREKDIMEEGGKASVAVDGVLHPGSINNNDHGTNGNSLAVAPDPNGAAPRPDIGAEANSNNNNNNNNEEHDMEFASALRISAQTSRAAPGAFHVLGMDRVARVPMQGTLEQPDNNDGMEAEDAATTPAHNNNPPTIFHATVVPDNDSRENNIPRTASANNNNNSSSNDNNNSGQEVVDPTVVVHAVKDEGEERGGGGGGDLSRRGMMGAMIGILILVVIIILLALGLSGVLGGGSSSSSTSSSSQDSSGATATTTRPNLRPTTPPNDIASTTPTSSGNLSFWSPTLERIQKEGIVRFGHTGYFPGLLYLNQEGVVSGFFVDIYGIIAAALNATAEFVDIPVFEVTSALVNGTVDVLIRGYIHEFSKQVYEPYSQSPLSFSYPYGHTGLAIAGVPQFVDCLDNNFQHLGNCSDLMLCHSQGYRQHAVLDRYIPQRNAFLSESHVGSLQEFTKGKCNVIMADTSVLISEGSARGAGYEGEYKFAKTVFQQVPNVAVLRPDDPKFADFVSFALQSVFAAGLRNISKSTADTFEQTDLFGEYYKDMFRNAIRSVGTFPELLDLHFGRDRATMAISSPNNGSTGLLFPYPLGEVEQTREGRPLSARMLSLIEKGRLHCGVVVNRPGFANKTDDDSSMGVFAGMDIDYCRAVAAALFHGGSDSVDFVVLDSISDGYVKLASGELDLLAGATWTLENDVQEPRTGFGFSFSKPYFYGYSETEDNFCLAVRQDDHDWDAFVYWVVMATIIAEDRGINLANSTRMPEVFVFGSEYNRMFRDAVLAVGSYEEIYNRNLEGIVARGGRNVLNNDPQHWTPNQYIVPGLA